MSGSVSIAWLISVKNADIFAEIAIGLNPNFLINGDFEEEKKALGNVHFALGKTPVVYSAIHMDLIMREGTVKIDDKIVLKKRSTDDLRWLLNFKRHSQ